MNQIQKFLDNTQPNVEYYSLVTGAAIIALFGILVDSIAVLIAAMIVAPLIEPIIAAAYGFVSWQPAYMLRAGKTFGLSLLAVLIVTAVGLVIFHSVSIPLEDRTFISFVPQPVAALAIAVVGGVFATLGIFSRRIDSIVVGVGIAVSLMPPLVASGIGIVAGLGSLVQRGAIIFGLNVLGIFVGSACMFFLMKHNIFNFRHYMEERRAD